MPTIAIYVTDQEYTELTTIAQEKGLKVSEVTQDAIKTYLVKQTEVKA